MGLLDKLADIAVKNSKSAYTQPVKNSVKKFAETNLKKDNTSTGSSGGSSQSTATSNVNNSAYYYAQAQAQAEAEAERRRKEKEALAKKAYKKNMSALSEAYARRADALKGNYDSTVGTLGDAYNQSKGNINTVSNNALTEAYINRMLAQKNMAQNMTAQGMSGGLSETTMAGLQNNYGNARNEIENTRSTNLSDLETTYQGNLASALQQYNAQLANDEAQKLQYQMQLENDLANAIASSYTDKYASIPTLAEAYTQRMQALADSQAAYEAPEGTQITNEYEAVTLPSSLSEADANRYIQYAKKVKSNGYSDEALAEVLQRNYNLNTDALAYILNQLN